MLVMSPIDFVVGDRGVLSACQPSGYATECLCPLTITHSDTTPLLLPTPLLLLAAVLQRVNPSTLMLQIKPFVRFLHQCFQQTERAVRQPVFSFIDKGGFVGKESYTILLGALSYTNDLLASERLEWKTKIGESGSLKGKKLGGKKKREREGETWIRRGMRKVKVRTMQLRVDTAWAKAFRRRLFSKWWIAGNR